MGLGVNLGSQSYGVFPSYGSGTAIQIGEGGNIMITGILTNAAGEPQTYKAGVLEPISANSKKQIVFFTNKSGRFTAIGLKEGKWAMDLNNNNSRLVIDVKKSGTGLVNLGAIVVLPATGAENAKP